MTAPGSMDEVLEWLRKHFDADAARSVRAKYQFHLAGPPGGSFHARVDEGRLDVSAGEIPAPDVTFRLTAADFRAILDGRENADLLFMAQRIEIDGDLSLALKLRVLFRRDA